MAGTIWESAHSTGVEGAEIGTKEVESREGGTEAAGVSRGVRTLEGAPVTERRGPEFRELEPDREGRTPAAEVGFLFAIDFGPARESQEIKIYVQTTME